MEDECLLEHCISNRSLRTSGQRPAATKKKHCREGMQREGERGREGYTRVFACASMCCGCQCVCLHACADSACLFANLAKQKCLLKRHQPALDKLKAALKSRPALDKLTAALYVHI